MKQTRSKFEYGYEYLGNSGRLVITPLTDRCFMTLTTALHLRRGGNPQGPAGTGKTESVKDLGKAIAKYVIVFNCSDGLDYKSMGRMFSGLAQTGGWSCFDEFNRIDVEVLSVVAQQILCILNAVGTGLKTFNFEGKMIKLNPTCGIFVTMNPGYAGRSELPDNLKALLRPISMMVPDAALIAEIMLFSEGFQSAKILSKKLTLLYQLMIQQLSKQDHYDFGLRAIKSALVAAGALKRSDAEIAEEMVLFRTLRDMNVPKLVSDDVKLFNALLSDFFPGIEPPILEAGSLQKAIEAELTVAGLQQHPTIIKKTIQTYETKLTRHGNMLVGWTGTGKSTAWSMLAKAMTRLRKENVAGFDAVKPFIINPKSLSMGELYGEYDLATNEWTDGVLSRCMRDACADEKPDQKWLVLDGPVDTLWIESMNTVLDDNKMLTLVSGERISMPPQVSLLFEVQDLAVASPATVSRAGMVYFDINEFGWEPFMESWLAKRPEKAEKLRGLFARHVGRVLEFRKRECREPVPTSPLNCVVSLCAMLDAIYLNEGAEGQPKTKEGIAAAADDGGRLMEMWLIFCLIWTVGASVDSDGRSKIDMCIREVETAFPSKNTVYEYTIDPEKQVWTPWEDKVPSTWRPLPGLPFYKMLVPTVDTVRYSFVENLLLKARRNTVVVGDTGTGKTFLLQGLLAAPSMQEGRVIMTMNFSARTTSNRVQEIIEGRLEKRTKDVFGPPGGKKMIVFLDDLNMPARVALLVFHLLMAPGHFRLPASSGTSPTLAGLFILVRPSEASAQVCQGRAATSLNGLPWRFVYNFSLLMSVGGRSAITPRLLSRFHLVNFTFPSDPTISRIFGLPLSLRLVDFPDEVKSICDAITLSTLELYNNVCSDMLPTPSRSHYLFNLRDLCKVLEGLLRATPGYVDTRDSILKLWVHECFRVFHDRLIDQPDRDLFTRMVDDRLAASFDTSLKNLYDKKPPTPFGDFMREVDNPPYEEYPDLVVMKKFMEGKLEDYNMEPGNVGMNLVLFRDAIEHITRIARIIRSPRAHALLVGVGGSGRQSLTRIATYMCNFKLFMIEITKQYRSTEFHDDLKKLYNIAGVENKPVVFLFSDTQIVVESFLEDVSGILSSGEVANLFAADELSAIRDSVRKDAKTAGLEETNEALNAFFVERSRTNLHIVLCMSPIGDTFRNRCRMFPALVNCTTIDWFRDWPAEALKEVAMRLTESVDLGAEDVRNAVTDMMATVHWSVSDMSVRMKTEMKRNNYVTPTNYLELVTGYKTLLVDKRKQLGDKAGKLKGGLSKLEEAKGQVEVMSVELEKKKKEVLKAQKECEELLVVIVQERRQVDEQQKIVSADAERISKEEKVISHSETKFLLFRI